MIEINKQLMWPLAFLLGAIIFGYILGLSVINTVDRKLSNISINMPKVNLPKQDIYVNVDPANANINVNEYPKNYHIESFVGGDKSREYGRVIPYGPENLCEDPRAATMPLSAKKYPVQERTSIDMVSPMAFKRRYDNKDNIEQLRSHLVSVFDGIPGDLAIDENNSNWPVAPRDQVCPKDLHKPNPGKCWDDRAGIQACSDTEANATRTYYMDPKNMNMRQMKKFMKKAKLDKMTPQDYMNWLQVHVISGNAGCLAPAHKANLEKMKECEPLKQSDIPVDETCCIPTAKEYYEKRFWY